MFRGSIATVLARLHGNFERIEVIEPIYKETWWAEQRKAQEKEKILFYRGRSLLTELNVGTIGHVDNWPLRLWQGYIDEVDPWLQEIVEQNYQNGFECRNAFGFTGDPSPY